MAETAGDKVRRTKVIGKEVGDALHGAARQTLDAARDAAGRIVDATKKALADTLDAARSDGEETAEVAQNARSRGGGTRPYEEWTKGDLYERAQELDVEGRSDMTKTELISALRGS